MNKVRILICPLEWGLGHASRCLPLAHELDKKGCQIIFAAGGSHLSFLKSEFPGAEFLHFPGFNPTYSRFLPMWMALLLRLPLLAYHILHENRRLKNIIAHEQIDIVISDNRFGLWNNKVKTVYLTHQIRVRFPKWTLFLEPLGAAIHRWIIEKYDYCFIPDFPGSFNLSGALSHTPNNPPNTRFIGPLSRFKGPLPGNVALFNRPPRSLLLILSGPEPQKSIFKRMVVASLEKRIPRLVVLGAEPQKGFFPETDGNKYSQSEESVIYYPHLPVDGMKQLILESDMIITRPGYTAIMELVSLRRSALLVPTPGQTEQEYLASLLSQRGWFATVEQNKISPEIINLNPNTILPEYENGCCEMLLENALKELLMVC